MCMNHRDSHHRLVAQACHENKRLPSESGTFQFAEILKYERMRMAEG